MDKVPAPAKFDQQMEMERASVLVATGRYLRKLDPLSLRGKYQGVDPLQAAGEPDEYDTWLLESMRRATWAWLVKTYGRAL